MVPDMDFPTVALPDVLSGWPSLAIWCPIGTRMPYLEQVANVFNGYLWDVHRLNTIRYLRTQISIL